MDKRTGYQKIWLAFIILIVGTIKAFFLFIRLEQKDKTAAESTIMIKPCHINIGCLLPNGGKIEFVGIPSSKKSFQILFQGEKTEPQEVMVAI